MLAHIRRSVPRLRQCHLPSQLSRTWLVGSRPKGRRGRKLRSAEPEFGREPGAQAAAASQNPRRLAPAHATQPSRSVAPNGWVLEQNVLEVRCRAIKLDPCDSPIAGHAQSCSPCSRSSTRRRNALAPALDAGPGLSCRSDSRHGRRESPAQASLPADTTQGSISPCHSTIVRVPIVGLSDRVRGPR